ncbi:MAG TPA: carbonic anhydrase [Stellaceae bacterium]|nr:carbonic anhydrase [Stellaceae bacterium]
MAQHKELVVPTGTGQADAVLLSCIDYRLPGKIARYMKGRGLAANYDHVILAGASLGATTTLYPQWEQTFRDHLDLAIKLHAIRRVIILDHRECGSCRVIFGTNLAGDEEKAQHARELHRLAREIHATHPALEVETLLMSLDGSVETIA